MAEYKDQLVVVGVGETDYGRMYEEQKRDKSIYNDSYGMIAVAFKRALKDAGLKKEMIDGIGFSEVPSVERIGETVGVNPRWAYAGGSADAMISAALALHAGLADYIAIVQGNNQRSAAVQYGGPEAMGGGMVWAYIYWSPWGLTSQGGLYALMFHRHMHEYGTTEQQLGAVAVAQRKAALLNPNAVMRKPLSIDEYIQSRYICWPLHLYDYCLINDGATAIIVTTPDNAKKLNKPPVYLSGWGKADANVDETTLRPRIKDFYRPWHKLTIEQVYPMAGINQGDIDSLEVYDSFSCHIPFALEGYGFCPVGQGGKFIQDGAIEIGGKLPVNTSGGMLSETYMRGWNHQIEAVRQLRGECGERQVDNCKYIQYVGDAVGKVTTLVYRRD